MARNLLGEIDSLLAWRVGGRLLVARERIALLEAVMEHKSITKAAEITGFSYKTAWDAVNAINNLLPRPGFVTRTGGSHGAGAEVTDEGRRFILTFLAPGRWCVAMVNASSVMVAQKGAAPRLSARNKIAGTVVRRTDDGADSEVTIDIGGGKTITAVVTREGADEAGARTGAQVLAVFKASHVILASD